MVTCREAKGYYNCRHVHDYLGAIEYDDERLYTEEGRINLTETLYDQHEYTLRDHLGNARVCIDQDGNLLQETHYYAYGLPMADLSRTLVATGNGGRDNKYQYNGIEHIDEYGLMTAQARYRSLDLQLGTWGQIDPLAETPGLNRYGGYTHVYDNPISYADPLGLCPNCPENANKGDAHTLGGPRIHL